MHVAVISFSLPTPGQQRGGIERVAHDLAQGLVKRGHRVTVWSTDPKPPIAAYDVKGLPWKGLSQSWLGRRLLFGYLGNIVSILPDYSDADVIISHGDSVLLPLRGKPIVRVMHGSALSEARTASSVARFIHQLGVYFLELSTGFTQPGCVGVSHNSLRHNPFVRRVIPNGIDLSLYQSASGSKSKEPSILFVGALEGRKRGNLLLDWFATSIRHAHSTATLTIVGGDVGPSVDGVKYLQGISPSELAALYRNSWIYASPSSYEGFGLPYVEAMASGTPVIATPNPGSCEVLDGGRFGILVEDDAFAPTINRLLSDADERAMWAQLGLQRAQTYSMESMVTRYEAVMADILQWYSVDATQRI